MAQDVLNHDVHVNGTLSAKLFNPPSGCIDDDAIEAAAEIGATKVVHQFPVTYQQPIASAVVAATAYLHIARGDGTIASLEAAVDTVATGADRTVTIDLKKSTAGGAFASVLTGTLVHNDASTSRTATAATVNTTSYVDGDIFQLTVAVAGAAGNQALGLVVTLNLQESPL